MYKNILAIGETHHGTHFKEIKKIFDDLKNINKIFFEKSVSDQNSVDYHIKTAKLNDRLSRYFENALKEGNSLKETEIFILDFAIKNNIPVICIDSSKIQTGEYNKISPHGKWFLKGESRDEDMFNRIVENYNEEEKVIIFCGANHLLDGKHFRTGKETFGTKLKNKFGDNYERKILK